MKSDFRVCTKKKISLRQALFSSCIFSTFSPRSRWETGFQVSFDLSLTYHLYHYMTSISPKITNIRRRSKTSKVCFLQISVKYRVFLVSSQKKFNDSIREIFPPKYYFGIASWTELNKVPINQGIVFNLGPKDKHHSFTNESDPIKTNIDKVFW